MITSEDYIEVRCPGDKPHGKYERCGGLMGGIDPAKEASYIFRCSCGKAWRVEYKPEEYFTFKLVSEKVPMQRVWREVISD